MDKFTKVDIDKWARKDEYEFFTSGGCGFTVTSQVDITNLYTYAKSHNIKVYPLMVALVSQVINVHTEFKYNWCGDDFGYYDVVHPLFFDMNKSGNTKALFVPYNADTLQQVAMIESVKRQYKDVDAYRPQPNIPINVVNISVLPWIKASSISFCLKYCDGYYPPIITFDRYEQVDNKVLINMSVYCNHAVNDGSHACMLINEFSQRALALAD
ncbi:MAG: CatA-like O-acetyltransferase [Clostridia bacterium]|nr:CatA-like O-acetyltransferase [Clostridia bacterium]